MKTIECPSCSLTLSVDDDIVSLSCTRCGEELQIAKPRNRKWGAVFGRCPSCGEVKSVFTLIRGRKSRLCITCQRLRRTSVKAFEKYLRDYSTSLREKRDGAEFDRAIGNVMRSFSVTQSDLEAFGATEQLNTLKKQHSIEQRKRSAAAALSECLAAISAGRLPESPCPFPLHREERCHITFGCAQAFMVVTGISTTAVDIGGLWLANSETRSQVQYVFGSLTITSRRIVFLGDNSSGAWELNQILKAEPFVDARKRAGLGLLTNASPAQLYAFFVQDRDQALIASSAINKLITNL